MNISTIAFDMDGTLLTSDQRILAENLKVIETLRKQGVKILLVTGRHHTAVRPFYAMLDLDTPVVCCNGTYIYDFHNEKILQNTPFDSRLALELIENAKKEQIHTAVYIKNAMVFEEINPHFEKLLNWVNTVEKPLRPEVFQVPSFKNLIDEGMTVWKVLLSDSDTQKLQKFTETLPLNKLSAEWSWIDRLDISMAGNGKGNRLLELLQEMQINPEEVMAFGDNINDISMLNVVGHAVAMKGCKDEVVQASDVVIGSHDEPSIADYLTNFFKL